MAAEFSIAPVLEQYPGLGPIRRVYSLANAGGFSGAWLWRLEREAGDLCLRRWPQEHPTPERLAFIHGNLLQFALGGLTCIPLPLTCRSGQTFVASQGHLWELTSWMPGRADFLANPSHSRLAGVLETVAKLHRVAERNAGRVAIPPFGVSPTLLARHEQLSRLQTGEADEIAAAVRRFPSPPLQERGTRLLAHFRRRAPLTEVKIKKAMKIKGIALFPVIRDLWHDHILFTDNQVTGIIDFGAMQVDSAACDLSRLLGSLVGNDRDEWLFARESYSKIRPISPGEWELVEALDESILILAGLNWLDWICVQGRTFEDYGAIYDRLDEMLLRLEQPRSSSPA